LDVRKSFDAQQFSGDILRRDAGYRVLESRIVVISGGGSAACDSLLPLRLERPTPPRPAAPTKARSVRTRRRVCTNGTLPSSVTRDDWFSSFTASSVQCLPKAHSGFDKRIEQIERRAADDLQHLRGRCLLLQPPFAGQPKQLPACAPCDARLGGTPEVAAFMLI
jgi:hypothetical protein